MSSPVRLLRVVPITLVLVASSRQAAARPSWAAADDRADEKGHTFVCEGEGKTEEDALAAAAGICNDKICKVCGVEVESVVETRETLKGVELQRKVVERCRRVRKQEAKVQYRSTDCGPDGCTAWVQVFYSKDDEKAECPAYASEKFADPAACEKDIDELRGMKGRHAAELRRREALLDAALGDCAQIDVRPTPAIMALDEKLRAALGSVPDPVPAAESWRFHEAADAFLKPFAPMVQQILETKLLVDRIRIVRDWVHNRALVIEVAEAADAADLDSPAGIERMLAALRKAPEGAQYDTPWPHFYWIHLLEDAKTDAGAYGALIRAIYDPSRIPPEYQSALAGYFRHDERVTADEWRYARVMAPGRTCLHCLRMLLEARQHEPAGSRVARLVEALDDAGRGLDDRRQARIFMELLPYGDARFVLDAEKQLPPAYRARYGLELYDEMMKRIDFPPVRPEARVLVRRIADVLLAAALDGERGCRQLVDRFPTFVRYGVPLTDFDARTCACLEGPLAAETVNDSHKDALYTRALERDLPCVR